MSPQRNPAVRVPEVVCACLLLASVASALPSNFHDCAKWYQPQNYMAHLPSLSLPYMKDIPIPNNMAALGSVIKPTPVLTTKVVHVVTKYVAKHPICIKVTSRKAPCKLRTKTTGANSKEAPDLTVTKELIFENRQSARRGNKMMRGFGAEKPPTNAEHLLKPVYYNHVLSDSLRPKSDNNNNNKTTTEDSDDDNDDDDYYVGDENDNNNDAMMDFEAALHPSELAAPRSFEAGKASPILPGIAALPSGELHELLVEDRLDRLEQLLPDYKRLRRYETTTITVTKTRHNHKQMATLVVKNCIPEGIEFCDNARTKAKTQSGAQKHTSQVTNRKKKIKRKP